MKKIAITGLSGAIGMRLLENLPDDFKIYDLYHTNKVLSKNIVHKHIELLNPKNILNCLEEINPDTIIHMASITHIDKCEEDFKNGKKGTVWKVNVEATEIISKFCKKNKKNLIFLSTECVFDGNEQSYDEESVKNPKNWYGKTKSEAENTIQKNYQEAAIIRAVIAYHEMDQEKTLFGRLYQLLKEGKSFGAVTDQMITPTYTDDIIKAIMLLFAYPQPGIFHISPEVKTTTYDFALKIAQKFGFDQSLIIKQTLKEYFGEEGAKLRLKNSCLNGDKTKLKLGFTPLTIDQVLDKIKI